MKAFELTMLTHVDVEILLGAELVCQLRRAESLLILAFSILSE